MIQISMLIIETEQSTREFLKRLMLENGMAETVYVTEDANRAVELAIEYSPDIVLLDIKLAGQKLNGLEIAKLIRQVRTDVEFIFVTDDGQHALDSFVVHPFDYILKPINIDKLLDSVGLLKNKLYHRIAKKQAEFKSDYGVNYNQRRLVLEEIKKMLFLPIAEILYLEKQKNQNKVHIFLENNSKIYESSKKLHEFEAILSDNFMRTHRSYIVNLDKVIKISEVYDRSYEVEFKGSDGKAVLSRYKLEEFQMRITSIVNSRN